MLEIFLIEMIAILMDQIGRNFSPNHTKQPMHGDRSRTVARALSQKASELQRLSNGIWEPRPQILKKSIPKQYSRPYISISKQTQTFSNQIQICYTIPPFQTFFPFRIS
jgi:hypothetical protein